jgi:hypothetical protein
VASGFGLALRLSGWRNGPASSPKQPRAWTVSGAPLSKQALALSPHCFFIILLSVVLRSIASGRSLSRVSENKTSPSPVSMKEGYYGHLQATNGPHSSSGSLLRLRLYDWPSSPPSCLLPRLHLKWHHQRQAVVPNCHDWRRSCWIVGGSSGLVRRLEPVVLEKGDTVGGVVEL